MNNLHILFVDDDPSICKLAKVNLEARSHTVETAHDAIEAIDIFKADDEFDLLIVDVSMPGIDGIDLCYYVRARSSVPIIILSAHDEEELKVKALDAGADDYVTKPFGYEELLARVRAVMRRSKSGELAAEQVSSVQIGDLSIDLDARRVTVGGVEIHLTQTEFSLLAELSANLDKIVTHRELLTRVWGPEYRDESHYLYIYFGRIRDKIGVKYSEHLQNVPGMGYTLRSTIEPQNTAAQ